MGHVQYAARCLVYQVSVVGTDFGALVRRIKTQDLISVTQDTLSIDMIPQPFRHDYTSGMAGFEGEINGNRSGHDRLPFPLLFLPLAIPGTGPRLGQLSTAIGGIPYAGTDGSPCC